jgi:hypothetical protein
VPAQLADLDAADGGVADALAPLADQIVAAAVLGGHRQDKGSHVAEQPGTVWVTERGHALTVAFDARRLGDGVFALAEGLGCDLAAAGLDDATAR